MISSFWSLQIMSPYYTEMEEFHNLISHWQKKKKIITSLIVYFLPDNLGDVFFVETYSWSY